MFSTNRKIKNPVSALKHIFFASAIGFFFSKALQPLLLPLGPLVDVPMHERPVHSAIDPLNDSLRLKRECGIDVWSLLPSFSRQV
jgi:hypothetical protein